MLLDNILSAVEKTGVDMATIKRTPIALGRFADLPRRIPRRVGIDVTPSTELAEKLRDLKRPRTASLRDGISGDERIRKRS